MKKILVVDDTKNIRIMLTKCLELEGYEVKAVESGKLALEQLEIESYNLIMMDIKMPELSGTETLRQIRQRGIMTPVIIMTAYGTIKNAVDTTKLGAIAYLQKPFRADKIAKLLAEFETQNLIDGMKEQLVGIKSQLEEGDYEKSIKQLKELLKLDSLNADIYYLLHKAYKGLYKEEHAKKYFALYQSIKE